MATKLQRLLGLAPLESLRTRASRDMEMERPINNYFGQQQSPEVLAPLNIQSPTQSFFNQEMQNIGLQRPNDVYRFGPDQTGGDDGGTGGGYGDVDPNEGSGMPTGPGTDGETSMGSGRFLTDPADLMSNFLSGLGEKRASELTGYLEDNTLDFDELAALAGFDINKLKAEGNEEDYNTVKRALQGQFGRYSDVFDNVPNQLRNLQELRGTLFGQELDDASQAYGSLMDFVDQGSVSGLEMGITETRTEQATQNLENALQKQLTSAEGQYLNELDSLLASTAGSLSENLAQISSDFISQNKDLAEYLRPGAGSDSGSGSSGTQTQGGNPATYGQIYNLYNIDSQDMQTIQSYINRYFMNNNYYPTSGELDAYIQSLGYGQDEEMA